MLKISHVFGAADSGFKLDPSELTGDINVDSKSAYVTALVAGRVAAIGADGYIKLCDGLGANGETPEGFIINDAAGYFMENTPALASGVVTVLVGGGVASTDQVVDTDITSGDKLYVGTGANIGLLTTTAPAGATVFAVARTSNSASDKTVQVRFV
jgi:hypothetical protein